MNDDNNPTLPRVVAQFRHEPHDGQPAVVFRLIEIVDIGPWPEPRTRLVLEHRDEDEMGGSVWRSCGLSSSDADRALYRWIREKAGA